MGPALHAQHHDRHHSPHRRQGGQWRHAADIFAQMQAAGCRPDVVTYTALIAAYERGGKWLRALDTFHTVSAPGRHMGAMGAAVRAPLEGD